MTHFNIVHVMKNGMHGPRAYQEIIDSVRWGLQQLGHDTTYSVDSCCDSATNIIFGGHLAPELLIRSREDSIYYNLEQIRGHPQYFPSGPANTVAFVKSNFQIWDYSSANIETWNRLIPKHEVKFLPVGYAPILTRIGKAEEQDIDVLIYGSVGEQRLSVFASLDRLINGMSTVFACGLYGAARDSLIARSKIVLNVTSFPRAKIFEIVRVSYLLANSKAVVADVSLDSHIEADIAGGIAFVPIEMIAETCWSLLVNKDHRIQLERQGFECISRRDIRLFLDQVLS